MLGEAGESEWMFRRGIEFGSGKRMSVSRPCIARLHITFIRRPCVPMVRLGSWRNGGFLQCSYEQGVWVAKGLPRREMEVASRHGSVSIERFLSFELPICTAYPLGPEARAARLPLHDGVASPLSSQVPFSLQKTLLVSTTHPDHVAKVCRLTS